jgi:hypothetical protein
LAPVGRAWSQLTLALSTRCCLSPMNSKTIGGGARWALNALTGVLSVFGVWGWLSDIESWPPALADAGSLALAAVTATTQHLANAAAAHAFYALQAGRGFSCSVGLMLAVAFAAVTSQGIEHALANHDAFKREEVAAPIRADISNVEASIQSDRGALRRLPTDVPGSRLRILQAPMRAAIDDGEARLLVLRAQLAETLAQGDTDHARRHLFALLGFCEPAAYWLLASSASRPIGTCPDLAASSVPCRAGSVPAPTPRRGMGRGGDGDVGVDRAWRRCAPARSRCRTSGPNGAAAKPTFVAT